MSQGILEELTLEGASRADEHIWVVSELGIESLEVRAIACGSELEASPCAIAGALPSASTPGRPVVPRG